MRVIRVKLDLTKIEVEHSYRFDSAYDETITNQELYEDAIRPLIYYFFQGAKVSCFAYGQTGRTRFFVIFRQWEDIYDDRGYEEGY